MTLMIMVMHCMEFLSVCKLEVPEAIQPELNCPFSLQNYTAGHSLACQIQEFWGGGGGGGQTSSYTSQDMYI